MTALTDVAQQVRELVELLVNPSQASQQIDLTTMLNNTGDQNFAQVRAGVMQLHETLQNTRTVSYSQVIDMVTDTGPKVTQLQGEVTTLQTRLETAESNLGPILTDASTQIQALQVQSSDIQTTVGQEIIKLQQREQGVTIAIEKELTEQKNRHTELIGHATDKFKEIQTAQDVLVTAARDKFTELEQSKYGFETQVATKMSELDQKMAQVTQVYDMIVALGQQDVNAARVIIAEKLGTTMSDGGGYKKPFRKEISEYKAVTALMSYSGDSRVGYKAWTDKLKNTLDQTRGTEWRRILNAVELHRITDDFEELTSADDKWDDWFEGRFGKNRTDGTEPVNLAEFKTDINWILNDKLGADLCELIKKHELNGLRGYKKLYIWSVDISNTVKQDHMTNIMKPPAAKSDGALASAIEKWDQDRADIRKIDGRCVLQDPFLLTAFKSLCTPNVLKFIDEQMDSGAQEDYEEVRKRVYGYALKRRLSEKPKDPPKGPSLNNVETDDMSGGAPSQHNTWGGGQGGWPQDPGWYGQYGHYQPDVDVLGKGKAASKGGKGGGKGGSKGGGKGQGPCWTCGGPHMRAQCPQGKGSKGGFKGKGKGKGGKSGGKNNGGFKGKGKGFYEVSPGTEWQGQEGNYWVARQDQEYGYDVNWVANFQGQCFHCGEWGHSAKYCPKNPQGVKPPGAAGEQVATVQPGGDGATIDQKKVSFGPTTTHPVKPLGSLTTIDFGGQDGAEGPRERDLKNMFEEAGWRVTKRSKGKNQTIMPDMQSVLDLCTIDPAAEINGCAKSSELPVSVPTISAVSAGRTVTPAGKVWKEVRITVDSGACDHVVPPKVVEPSKVRITEAVRRGVKYATASGEPLPNLGETEVTGVTENGRNMSLTMQVAGVKKPLASVRKMCSAGNRVVFEDEEDESIGGYVYNKSTGETIPIKKEGGTYEVKMWSLREEEEPVCELCGMSEDEDEEKQDGSFIRHA